MLDMSEIVNGLGEPNAWIAAAFVEAKSKAKAEGAATPLYPKVKLPDDAVKESVSAPGKAIEAGPEATLSRLPNR